MTQTSQAAKCIYCGVLFPRTHNCWEVPNLQTGLAVTNGTCPHCINKMKAPSKFDLDINQKFFSFDIESAGFNGQAFAIGYVIYKDQMEVESGMQSSGLHEETLIEPDRKWLLENIPENVQKATTSYSSMFIWFSDLVQKHHDAKFVVDCGFPVETNFMTMMHYKPYPLFDLSTLLFAIGQDPTATYDRHSLELPKHNPLCDARQTMRLWFKCMKVLKGDISWNSEF